jgi:excisionase family DNA binding protein
MKPAMTHKTKLLSEARPISPLRADAVEPLTMTVPEICRVTGYGQTTIWKFIKEKRIKVVRVPGVRRTLGTFASVKELLAPQPPPQRLVQPTEGTQPQRRRRGRPRKQTEPQPGATA